MDVMISVGNNFFYTKSLPCSLWFFDKAKAEAIRDKVLFIDARNYYTVVDRTLNEWTPWQLRNLNAIVWLHRGETEKYRKLLDEYRAALGTELPFAECLQQLTDELAGRRTDAKEAVASAERKQKKQVQERLDVEIADLEAVLTVAKEAVWLTDKFGEGVYADVPGLCKVAGIDEIEAKGWSLTPGAYVGVAPDEGDGVDFHARMKEIHAELLTLQARSNELMETISRNMKEMGL